MAVSKLEKTAWRPYFDQLSKTLTGKLAEVEIASLTLGNQVESKWGPLLGITYDNKSDLIEILLQDLDHLIRKPREIFIDYGASGLTSLEVIDADDVRQIIKLRDPLMLPHHTAGT